MKSTLRNEPLPTYSDPVPGMRWLSAMILVAGLSSCSLLTQFDLESQPCDSAGLCSPNYYCADSGLCLSLDGGATDAGSSDGGNCTARETACGDGLDNDCDGQKDCVDTDCSGIACSDGDPCTTGEVCSGGACPRGTAVVCSTPVGSCQTRAGTCQPDAGTCIYPALPDGTACGTGTTMASSRCCAGNCIDTSAAAGNCGGCGLACATGQTCQSLSACLPSEPANTSARCTCSPTALCPSGQTCTNGTCRPSMVAQCAPGQSVSLDGGTCGAYCRY